MSSTTFMNAGQSKVASAVPRPDEDVVRGDGPIDEG